jgi:antitoxin CptB
MRAGLSRQTPKSAADAPSNVQVYPMFTFAKDCFSRAARHPTFRLSLNRWRSVMQVLFKSRDPHATDLRDLAERRVRFVLRRLRWRCRRGLLENDIFIDRFFEQHEASLTNSLVQGLLQLMDLSDNDLLDLLLARKEPEGELDTVEVRRVLSLMRVSPA